MLKMMKTKKVYNLKDKKIHVSIKNGENIS